MANEKSPCQVVVSLDDIRHGDRNFQIVDELKGFVTVFRIALPVITQGRQLELVEHIRGAGCHVFYDARFQGSKIDIQEATGAACRLGAQMISVSCDDDMSGVHSATGPRTSTHGGNREDRPLIIGTSQLPSSDLTNLAISKAYGFERVRVEFTDESLFQTKANERLRELLLYKARLAAIAQADGFMIPTTAAKAFRDRMADQFSLICPLTDFFDGNNEENRLRMLSEARLCAEAGARYVIVGRPVTDPFHGTRLEALARLTDEMANAQL